MPGRPEQPHCFVYYISIHNDADIAVTIKARKWVVKDDEGGVLVVEGDGVVGQTPTIEPGSKFSYQSRHLLKAQTGEAEGSYIGLDALGRRVLVRIPRFRMTVPHEAKGGAQWA
ncbi:MAG: ApaG domain [Verrucomicrobia bacterium]|nr:ApaG domain [Verrucomicrobiota bacterium]